jgi:type IV pilus assembly protein PilQ
MNAERRIPIVLVVVSLALVLLVPTGSWAQAEPARLSDVTVTPHPDSVTVFVKTSREAQYKADLVDSPSRLVIDLENTVYAWRKTPLNVGKDPVKQVRGGQYRQGVARLVLDLSRSVGYAIREESDGLAIVIPTAAPPAAAARSAPAAAGPGALEAPPAPAPRPVQIAQATPPAAPPAPTNGQRLISFDFKDADVVNLLRILAAESNKNVVIGDDVKGKMSITLKNVPWDLALDTILETRGLRKVEKDGVLRIVSNEQLIKEREAAARVEEARMKAESDVRAKIAEAQLKEQEAIDKKRLADQAVAELRARGPLREETIRLSYADPEEIARTLQGILGIPPGGIQAQVAPVAEGMPPIAAPPFSALYGTAPQIPLPPPPSPTAEVLAKGITIRPYKPTNSIFIRHYEADLERIKTLIREKLDVPLPQVKIEARMEILDRDDLFAIGVQWGGGGVLQANQNSILVGRGFTSDTANNLSVPGTVPVSGVFGPANLPAGTANLGGLLPVSGTTGLPQGGNLVNLPIGAVLGGGVVPAGAGGIAFGFTSNRYNINLALEALRLLSKTRTLARPEVVTVENGTASISLGEEIPYATVSSAGTQIQFKEAVLRLDVIPTVIREGDITKIKMKVTIENNSRSNTTVNLGTTAGAPPVINKRKAQTEVLIKEGERLVIGGVTTNLDQDETRKIPLFGDIPVLGWLFKQTASQTTGRELVVFITPSVLKVETAQAPPPPPAPKK